MVYCEWFGPGFRNGDLGAELYMLNSQPNDLTRPDAFDFASAMCSSNVARSVTSIRNPSGLGIKLWFVDSLCENLHKPDETQVKGARREIHP